MNCEPWHLSDPFFFSTKLGAPSLPLAWVTSSQDYFSMKTDTSSIQPRIQHLQQNSGTRSAKTFESP